MRFSARYLPVITLALLSVTVSLFAQSTVRQTSKTPRGTVSGRITIKDKAAAGVTVGMRKSEGSSRFEQYLKATTDQEGLYHITNVAAGSYDIMPVAPAFVMADAKDMRNKTVILGEDENVEGINFALVRGGAITGRVTDADGRPVIEQQVNLYLVAAIEQQSPERPIFSSGMAQTDDRGIYRMFGLSPGRYKVAVGAASGPMPPRGFNVTRVERDGVVVMPRSLEVKEGEQVTGIRVIVAHGNATLRGVVKLENGSLPAGARIAARLAKPGDIFAGNRPPQVDARGQFLMEGLPPGVYELTIMIVGAGPGSPRAVRREVTLQDGMVTEVSITIEMATKPKL